MLKNLYQILFHDRLDRMTSGEIEQAGKDGTLTFAEMKRVHKMFGQYAVTK